MCRLATYLDTHPGRNAGVFGVRRLVEREGTGDGSPFQKQGTENRPLFPLPLFHLHKSLQRNTTNHSSEIPQITPTKYHKLLQRNLIKTPGVLDITGKMKYCIIKVFLCLEVMKNGV